MTAQLNVDIRPIEADDGQFYLSVIIGGRETERRRGPFSSAAEAQAVAARLRAFGRALQGRA